MRVLHVITGLSTGGAERALYNVLSGGLADQFGTAVLSLGDEGTMGPRIHELGVPVYALNMRSGLPGPKVLAKLRRLVRSLNPDVIQGWMYHGNLAASLAGMFGPAVAWNVRHSLYDLADEKALTQKVIWGNRWLSNRVEAIVYNSRVSRRQHEAFGFYSARGRVIPNGFDLERLRPDWDKAAAIRRELGIPETAPVVGHVARFHPMKDHASFLRAAVRVAREFPTAHFLLVGRGVSLDTLGLAGIVPQSLMERFIFLGERSDAQILMQAMDVFCLSSWSEAFPNVIGEAMASGVPCVVTDVGDTKYIVGDTGVVVPPLDSEALGEGLLRVLEMNTEKRHALGRAARERLEAHYGLDSVVAQYSDLYKTMTDRG